jgi:DNA-binding response OmpR family regulator
MTDSHFSASNRTIMLVDDERELVAVVRTMLEENGFNVRCAYDGTQVFDFLKKQKPDLVILDIMMPQMDGLEVLTRLKGNPATASIPVILMTEKADGEDVMVGYKMGADFYIPKPFTKNQLLDGVNSILS